MKRTAPIGVVLILLTIAGWWIFHTPSYTGVVSGVRGFRSGLAINLDGNYPDQKMTVFVPRESAQNVDFSFLKVGERIQVIGKRSEYRGRPEIVVTKQSQIVRVP